MNKTLGQMIMETMEQKKISQSDLCKGLCSVSAFSRYLYNERKMDRLLMTAILQRLGKSPDMFITLLSAEEQQYFIWKQNLYQVWIQQDWKKAEILLEEQEQNNACCNAILQKQFSLIMKGMLQLNLYEDVKKARNYFEEAILLTIPEFITGTKKILYLSVQEINALLMWQRTLEDEKKAREILQYLLHYVMSNCQEDIEFSKLYPRICREYLPLLYEQEKYSECYRTAEKAMELIISTGYSASIIQICEYLIQSAEQIGKTEIVHRKKIQLAHFKELETVMEKKSDEFTFFGDVYQEIHVIHEMLERSRKEQGYTQEYISENICTPETYSRIETGKRAPNKKNYEAMAKKLSLKENYYYCDIETDNFEALEVKWKIDKHIMNLEWENAEEELKILIGLIGLSNKKNRLYIDNTRYLIDRQKSNLNNDERMSQLIERIGYALNKSIDSVNCILKDSFWTHNFSNQEMEILLQITDLLFEMKNIKQSVIILEKMLLYYNTSTVLPEFHYRTIILILQRLSSYNALIHDVLKELEYSEMGIQITFTCNNIKSLPFFLNNRADALEQLKQKKESLFCYKQAFYCGELIDRNMDISKMAYEKLDEKKYQWY